MEQPLLDLFGGNRVSETYFTEPYRVRVIEQVLQNALHFAVFERKLFDNFSY
jgi:hypothetical protein